MEPHHHADLSAESTHTDICGAGRTTEVTTLDHALLLVGKSLSQGVRADASGSLPEQFDVYVGMWR